MIKIDRNLVLLRNNCEPSEQFFHLKSQSFAVFQPVKS